MNLLKIFCLQLRDLREITEELQAGCNTARLRRIVGWVKHRATQQIRFNGWVSLPQPNLQLGGLDYSTDEIQVIQD